jgi:hypothetical protein
MNKKDDTMTEDSFETHLQHDVLQKFLLIHDMLNLLLNLPKNLIC